ncbi:MmcQ/YjbR family DNA-binding protein [Paenibacillus gallinarum]|uniref:MmcQ/YjbR family DNA-binding protein n=1 Tax=Paenibacillus gallinarum TaxID=2762232 RepID=A0ABR8T5I1_9BACL|nr:MmcQ/YjbR family DNA-binding protein [Paenibacillus gallinarum]MBD7971017.1 MmcQ/YjbR family DNA-binding protein [Paenibacillus gallinarum]
MMKREEIFEHVKEKYNTTPDYPWDKLPDYAVLRHDENDKWYGLIMNVEKNKLNLDGDDKVDILDIKCKPEFVGSLQKEEGFLPAYHMNKEHWISVVLHKQTKKKIMELLDESYKLTKE